MSEPTENPQGALGELLSDPRHARADIRMIRRALREGWELPAEVEAKIPLAMAEIAINAKDPRARVSAAKVLVEMERRNLEEDLVDEKNARLDAGKPTERLAGVTMNVLGPRRE